MKRTAIILMIITIISKVVGFLRESAMAYYFPTTSAVSNAFVQAQKLPVVLISLLAASITTSFIPIYNRVVEKDGKVKGDVFTSNANNISVALTIILLVILEIFAPFVVKLFAPGFTGYTRELTISFMRLSMIAMIPSIMACVYRGYLNANDHFLVQNLQGFILSLVLIISMVISTKYNNDMIVGIGLLVASSLQYLPFIPALKAKGYKYYPVFDIKDENIKMIIILSIPVLLGVAVNQINAVVDQSLVTLFSDKGATILNYSFKLVEFVSGVVITNISILVYPQFSKFVIGNKIDNLKEAVMGSFSMISVLVFPCTVGLMALSHPIIQLLYYRGEFTVHDVDIAAAALFFYAIGIMGIAVKEIISKVFYSMNDTKTPTINSVWMVLVNILGDILLGKMYGIAGLAMATSISSLFGSITMIMRFRKKLGSFKSVESYIKDIIKMFIASIVMGLVAYFLYTFMASSLNSNLALMVSIAVSGLSYLGLLAVLKVNELNLFLDLFKKKIRKK
ncbi:MAG: murein biosynthesis integral membrane protein MurJ [Finegoldia sp.]|nr:murein biosynthesis integral membrane protein MurJ [Finegoldia sp.]